MAIKQHTEQVNECLYDLVEDSKGDYYAVRTERLPGGEGMGRAYRTSSHDADKKGHVDWKHPIETEYSEDWEEAQITHAHHVEWISK